MTRLTLALLASAAFSTAALAQTAQQPQQQQQQRPAGAQDPAAQRQSGAAQTSKPVQYYTQRSEDHRVSHIIGASVRNPQNESVGEVEDLIMDKGGDVKAAIVSVGGFLGIGERWVAVSFDSLNLQQDGKNWRVILNTTRDQLKSAPEFKYENSWAQNRGPNTTATTPPRGATSAPADRSTPESRPSAPRPPAPATPAPTDRSPPAPR